MVLNTTRWDAAETLNTKDDVVAYLNAALEDGDPELLKLVLGDIARSKGMTEIAKAAGLGRSSLYRALSPEGNPEFATVASVLKALGLRLAVAREGVSRRRAPPRGPVPPALRSEKAHKLRYRREWLLMANDPHFPSPSQKRSVTSQNSARSVPAFARQRASAWLSADCCDPPRPQPAPGVPVWGSTADATHLL